MADLPQAARPPSKSSRWRERCVAAARVGSFMSSSTSGTPVGCTTSRGHVGGEGALRAYTCGGSGSPAGRAAPSASRGDSGQHMSLLPPYTPTQLNTDDGERHRTRVQAAAAGERTATATHAASGAHTSYSTVLSASRARGWAWTVTQRRLLGQWALPPPPSSAVRASGGGSGGAVGAVRLRGGATRLQCLTRAPTFDAGLGRAAGCCRASSERGDTGPVIDGVARS